MYRKISKRKPRRITVARYTDFLPLTELNRDSIMLVELLSGEYKCISLGAFIDLVPQITVTGVTEAPIDSKKYVRKDATWTELVFPSIPSVGSGLTLIQSEHEVFGGLNGQGGDYHFWYYASSYMENPIGQFFYDIYDPNIDANSIVEVIPLDSDSQFINGFGICMRNESHSGFVRIFADMPPYNIEFGRDFTVKLNIFKQVLKENEYVVEYNIIYYSPTGKCYKFMYWVDNLNENDFDQSGGISPLPPQFSTKPAGAAYNKYFLEYYDNGTIQVSGNVQSIEINGTLFETVNSYNATYNYTILAAPTNPFPESEIIGVTFDEAVLVKIIFNE